MQDSNSKLLPYETNSKKVQDGGKQGLQTGMWFTCDLLLHNLRRTRKVECDNRWLWKQNKEWKRHKKGPGENLKMKGLRPVWALLWGAEVEGEEVWESQCDPKAPEDRGLFSLLTATTARGPPRPLPAPFMSSGHEQSWVWSVSTVLHSFNYCSYRKYCTGYNTKYFNRLNFVRSVLI